VRNFLLFSDELSDITWIQAFPLIMQIFMNTLSDRLFLTSEQLDKFLDAFLLALPKELKEIYICVLSKLKTYYLICYILNFQGPYCFIYLRNLSY